MAEERALMGRGNGDLWKEKVEFLKRKGKEEKVGIEGSFRVVWLWKEQPSKPVIILFYLLSRVCGRA